MPATSTKQKTGASSSDTLLFRDPTTLAPEDLVAYSRALLERLRKRDQGLRTIREGYVELYNNNFPTRIVVNYIKPTVKKWAVYLLGKPIRYNVTREDEVDQKQLAKGREFTLNKGETMDQFLTRFQTQFGQSPADLQALEDFAQGVLDATMEREKLHLKVFQAGIDNFVIGGWGIKTYWDADAGIVRYTKVNPLNLFVEFKRNDADDPVRVLHAYQIDLLAAREKYGLPNLQPDRFQGNIAIDRYDEASSSALVTVIDVEDYLHKTRWLVAGETVIEPPSPLDIPTFTPGTHGYRMNGVGFLGESTVAEMASLNISICEDLYTFRKLTRANAYPMFKTWGPVDLRNWVPSENTVIPLGKKRGETDVEVLSVGINTFPMKETISTNLAMLHDISMMPDAAFGHFNASITSSVAMQTQLSPTLSVAESLKLQWETPLRRIAKLTLQNYAKYGDEKFKPLKDWYAKREKDGGKGFDVMLRWPNATPVDDVQHINNELTKFKSGMQSLLTTMENLGVEDTTYELRQILGELKDPVTNPSLRQQLQGVYIQSIAQQTAANIQTLAMQARQGAGLPAGAPEQGAQAGQAPQDQGATPPMDQQAQDAQVQSENQQLSAGQGVQVSPSDAHHVHISGHTQALRQASSPEARRAMQAHINEHQQALAAESGGTPTPGAPMAAPTPQATPPGVPAGA